MKSVVDLYRVPRSEFVRARDALAAQWRKAGRAPDARSVAGLKKPSAALWAVNHVAHEHRAAIRRLIEAIDRLKRAQVGRDGDVAAATRDQRAAVRDVTQLAEAALTRAGERASRQTLERVADTVFGAAADRDARVDLEHGRLTAERKPPGFEALLGTTPHSRRLRLVKPARAPRRR